MSSNLPDIVRHLRDRDYMSGVERTNARIKATGEVFTPTALVQEILEQLPVEQFTDPTKTFIDPTCGDGQFLSEVIIRKIENGSSYPQALETTYGVDLMEDNCRECIKRLYMCEEWQIRELGEEGCAEQFPDYQWSPGLKEIYVVNAEHYQGIANIVCADGLKYDYRFGEPLSDEEKIKLFTRELGIKRNKKNRIDPEVIGLFGF